LGVVCEYSRIRTVQRPIGHCFTAGHALIGLRRLTGFDLHLGHISHFICRLVMHHRIFYQPAVLLVDFSMYFYCGVYTSIFDV